MDISCYIYKGLYHGDVKGYILKYLKILSRMDCEIFLVFDGKPPAAKYEELKRRREIREAEHPPPEFSPNTDMPPRKSVPVITPELLEYLKSEFGKMDKVHIIQAPQESDPQMAYMALNEIVDFVITDDTDLVVYGCERIIFKLNPSGWCTMYDKAQLPNILTLVFPVFRWACIIAGCDYLPGGYKGLGLKKAMAALTKMDPQPPYDEDELRRILAQFKNVDEPFIEAFVEAERTFLHQNVLDTRDGCIKVFS